MQLHGAFGRTVLGLIEDLGAKIDDGAVQTKQMMGQRQTGARSAGEICAVILALSSVNDSS